MDTTNNKKSNYKKLIEVNAYSFITFQDLPDYIQKKWRVKFSRIPNPEELLNKEEIEHYLDNWSNKGTYTQAHTDENNVVQNWDITYYSLNDPNTSFDRDSEDFDRAIWQILNNNLYYYKFNEGKRWIEFKYLVVETEEVQNKRTLQHSLADS